MDVSRVKHENYVSWYFAGEDNNSQPYKVFDDTDYGNNELWAINMGSKRDILYTINSLN